MGKIVDKDGVEHEKGWNGEYRPKEGLFGPVKDTNILGQPKVQRDILGNPKVEKDWLGRPVKSRDGADLYQGEEDRSSGGSGGNRSGSGGGGSGVGSGGGEAAIFWIVLLVLGFVFVLAYKLLKFIFSCTKKGFSALSAGRNGEAVKYLTVPIGAILLVIAGYILITNSNITNNSPIESQFAAGQNLVSGNTQLSTNVNNPSPVISSTSTFIPASGSMGSVIVRVESANIRSGPGTDFGVVDYASSGDSFPYYGTNSIGNWIQIDELGGKWIAASLVNISIDPTKINNQNTSMTLEPSINSNQAIGIINDSVNPIGKIAFTCTVFRDATRYQICIVNADGTGFRQLTNVSSNYYPSVAPDGRSVIFVSNRTGKWEIYEQQLTSTEPVQITFGEEEWEAPEISPNGQYIAAETSSGNFNEIWIMNRDGSNQHPVIKMDSNCSEPVWSQSGTQILFACGIENDIQLFSADINGANPQKITELPDLPGRSDWSPDGKTIATFIGPSWHHEIIILTVDGTIQGYLTQGGNNNSPSFSPGGSWITYTSYQDHYGDDDGCEIYIMRIDGTSKTRLTNNDYCDFQPRWGP